eukprot:6800803-Pyramimonas_sp.AAC.1
MKEMITKMDALEETVSKDPIVSKTLSMNVIGDDKDFLKKLKAAHEDDLYLTAISSLIGLTKALGEIVSHADTVMEVAKVKAKKRKQ